MEEFERVLEQCGKLLRKRLADWFASNRQADRLTFKDLFRHAARHDLLDIETVERWLIYRDHTPDGANDSDEGVSKNTLMLFPKFLQDAKALADMVEKVGNA